MRGDSGREVGMSEARCFPCAKINVGLQVVARRADGFHDLRTVFLRVPGYHDEMLMEFGSAGASGLQLEVEGYSVQEAIEENLVWRAYDALKCFSPLPARVQLRKRIPLGAGLGGGSSDAASALQCFVQHCRKGVPQSDIDRIALRLGSDVPFFLRQGACYAEGRGEELEAISLPVGGMYIVVVTPPVHVSTGEAFGLVKPNGNRQGLREVLLNTPVEAWQGRVKNDFWPVLIGRYPQMDAVARELRRLGAVFTSLSGSGPSIYGLFRAPVEIGEGTFVGCRVYAGAIGEG